MPRCYYCTVLGSRWGQKQGEQGGRNGFKMGVPRPAQTPRVLAGWASIEEVASGGGKLYIFGRIVKGDGCL